MWALFSAAPAKQRNLMLKGILTQCYLPQLSYLSNSVRELLKIDFLSALPDELGLKILCYLDTDSLCKAAQVSQKWRQLADDESIWQKMCAQHIDRTCIKCGWGLPSTKRKRLRTTKQQTQLLVDGGINNWSSNIGPLLRPAKSGNAVNPSNDLMQQNTSGVSDKVQATDGQRELCCPPKPKLWKNEYKDSFKIGSNWKHGRYTSKVFNGHEDGVMCLQFNEEILATGSYDTTIKIWNIITGDLIRTIQAHEKGVRCLQFDDTKIISGSLDETIKIFDWRSGEMLRELNDHQGGVISLHYISTYLASGSMDNTVRVWLFHQGNQFCLRGHTDWVNAVRIDLPSRTVFSASDDLTVRLWDIDSRTTLRVFDDGHVGQIQQVVPLAHDFEFSNRDPLGWYPNSATSDDGSSLDAIINKPTRYSSNTHDFQYPSSGTSSSSIAPTPLSSDSIRSLPPRHMVTAALDSTIRLWSVHTGCCLWTSFGHVEGIWALAVNQLKIVSGSQDCTVKVWDIQSGRCEKTFMYSNGPVTCIGLSNSKIVIGSEDGEVRVLDFG